MDIAIVGMACKVPGADNLNDFWDLLSLGDALDCSDTDEHPAIRMTNINAFDNDFFRISQEEALFMDPQHRLCMEVTQHALQSAGDTFQNCEVGCWIGLKNVDYAMNVASSPASKHSHSGIARTGLVGKLCERFAWRGPSMTIDSGNSSSANAIYTACKALLHGDCTVALAGGCNLCFAPHQFEYLKAAKLISVDGTCRPFDSAAQGYVRSDGVGMLVLKRLEDAVEASDNILATIKSAISRHTAVIPTVRSNVDMIRDALRAASLSSEVIGTVEADARGDPYRDAVELEAMREVFSSEVVVASVKSFIGDCEAASGVIAIIKMVLQLQNELAFAPSEPTEIGLQSGPIGTTKLTAWRGYVVSHGELGSSAAFVLERGSSLAAHPFTQRGRSLKARPPGRLMKMHERWQCFEPRVHWLESKAQLWLQFADKTCVIRDKSHGQVQEFTVDISHADLGPLLFVQPTWTIALLLALARKPLAAMVLHRLTFQGSTTGLSVSVRIDTAETPWRAVCTSQQPRDDGVSCFARVSPQFEDADASSIEQLHKQLWSSSDEVEPQRSKRVHRHLGELTLTSSIWLRGRAISARIELDQNVDVKAFVRLAIVLETCLGLVREFHPPDTELRLTSIANFWAIDLSCDMQNCQVRLRTHPSQMLLCDFFVYSANEGPVFAIQGAEYACEGGLPRQSATELCDDSGEEEWWQVD